MTDSIDKTRASFVKLPMVFWGSRNYRLLFTPLHPPI